MAFNDYNQMFLDYDSKIDEMIQSAHNFRDMLSEISQEQLTNPAHLLWIAYQTRVKLNDVKLKEFVNIVQLLPTELATLIINKYTYQKTKKLVKFTYVLY
jgi:hypothetical protein